MISVVERYLEESTPEAVLQKPDKQQLRMQERGY